MVISTEKYSQNNANTAENADLEPKIEPQADYPENTSAYYRYGNFCGPGPIRDKSCSRLKSGKPLPNAKDGVDSACMDHDLDYCNNGLSWKEAYTLAINPATVEADKKLIFKIKTLEKQGSLNWFQKVAAHAIVGWFSGRHRVLR